MTEELNYTAVAVKDPQEALRFLTKYFGFFTYSPLNSFQNLDEGGVIIGNKYGNNYLLQSKSHKSAKAKAKGSKPIIIFTPDLIKDCHDLSASGFKFLNKPEYTPNGLEAEIIDKSGNRYKLVEKRKYAED